jgi:hypothetical protein
VIDKSNEIFNAVATDLRSMNLYFTMDGKSYSAGDGTPLSLSDEMPDIQVKGEYVATPTAFPTVTIDEIQNIPVHLDSGIENKFAEVVYRVQIFSNSKHGKRAQAREIYGVVDAKLQSLGLYAVSFSTTPAIYNSEIYSITATYRGVIDRNGVIYRG